MFCHANAAPVKRFCVGLFRIFLQTLTFAAVLLLPLLLTGSEAVDIENPTCELIARDTYRIDFESAPRMGAVDVYASSSPDRIDSTKPVATIGKVPGEVYLPGRSGRIYFHLKPASGATRVVSIRRLPMEGASNFRDLGGYRTQDGHYTRWGLVYRSDYLIHLTAKDSDYLNQLGIHLVCDVRADAERARAPDQWNGPRPEFVFVPIGPNRDGRMTAEQLKQRVGAAKEQAQGPAKGYDYAITDAAQFGKILRRVAAGGVPMVEHCTSGKDRTGVFSAILLTALGVPRETVMQDYLLTSKYFLAPESIDGTATNLQEFFGLPELPDLDTVKTLMTTRPETLEATFNNIAAKYGSFDNYLKNGLNLSDSDLIKLRQRLLIF
ncbi:MAG TPA: tyrosine-protein phosphatase [Candidatus Dormibacteraeota bacterium]|nr:tyrosine-protein phosphatase [Candidatus Dormibacteraeota bacterium]